MIIDESKAVEHDCPVSVYTQWSYMRANFDHEKCRGSKCIAWRWGETTDGTHSDQQGYCGLAGKP